MYSWGWRVVSCYHSACSVHTLQQCFSPLLRIQSYRLLVAVSCVHSASTSTLFLARALPRSLTTTSVARPLRFTGATPCLLSTRRCVLSAALCLLSASPCLLGCRLRRCSSSLFASVCFPLDSGACGCRFLLGFSLRFGLGLWPGLWLGLPRLVLLRPSWVGLIAGLIAGLMAGLMPPCIRMLPPPL